MQICQNPNCPNPFNSDGNRFCICCGQSNLGYLLGNRYRVLRLLGSGGFGRTYAAEDAYRFDHPCVIKQFFPQTLLTGSRTKAAELFKEEAKRLYELGENHPQIPKLFAYFEQGSSLYLVQEFIQGETLLTALHQHVFSEAQIQELLADLLPVLQFIHEHNVIHRDIKPENIIRRSSPPSASLLNQGTSEKYVRVFPDVRNCGAAGGDLVLIDFGSAKQVTQTSLGKPGTGIYTIGYAPTEQISGLASPASDLYALGATCTRLLTGCLALQDAYGNIHDRLYDAYNAEWLWRELLQEKGITISDNLGQILDKLLKHPARDRYQSAAEVLKDLNSTKILVIPEPIQPRVRRVMPSLQTFEFDVVL